MHMVYREWNELRSGKQVSLFLYSTVSLRSGGFLTTETAFRWLHVFSKWPLVYENGLTAQWGWDADNKHKSLAIIPVRSLLLLLLYAVTHAPFHAPVLRPTSWPNARDRRDGEVN